MIELIAIYGLAVITFALFCAAAYFHGRASAFRQVRIELERRASTPSGDRK